MQKQNTENKVKLEIQMQTEAGWQAEVLNSQQNKNVIIQTTSRLIAESARAGQR